ncbi:MAG: hypothetical protein AAF432_09005 [Planctomycetota bacterium]
MKIKGISIWEQYLEYIVLLIAVVVCVALVVLQFIGNPNAATVGGDTYGPGDVDQAVADAAARVAPKLEPSARSPIDIPDPVSLLDRYLAAQSDGVAPTEMLAGLGRPPIIDGESVNIGQDARPFRMPDVTAPYDIAVGQYFDALVEEQVQNNDALLAKYDDGPYDVTWTTVSANFDLDAILAAYDAESDEFGRIPSSWHNDRVFILDVMLERQQRTDDGWSDPEVIAILPGYNSLREQLEGDVDVADRDRMLGLLRDTGAQLEIVQPPFYETQNNSWLPPVPGADDDVEMDVEDDQDSPEAEERRKIERLRRNFEELNAKLNSNLQQQEDLDCDDIVTEDEEDSRGGGGSRPSGGDGGGGRGGGGSFAGGSSGGGAGRADPSGQNNAQQQRDIRKCRQLDRAEKNLRRQLENVAKELEKYNEEVVVVEEVEEVDPLTQDVLQIWAHDIDVEPYAEYRYRFSVKIYNPFFARGPFLAEEQQSLAEDITITSAASDWSRPMLIRPAFEDFIVKARVGGSRGRLASEDLGSATVEVYRFQHGRWWAETFAVEPGDRIGEARMMGAAGDEVEVDFGTDWFVLDIVSDFLASENDRSRGIAAVVQFQNMVTGEISDVRTPRREVVDPRRRDLRDEVELANSGSGQVAMGGSGVR